MHKTMLTTFSWGVAALLLLLLSACGTELETPGEELRMLAQTLDTAYLNEPYSTNLQIVGGLSPYTYEVSEGALPPGLELQGNTLRGTPTTEGNYTFTVTVSDANLSKTFREYTLQVTEAPPAELVLNVPETEMQTPFTLRARVQEARELQALRTSLLWDASRFELVPGSVRAVRNGLALFHQAEPGSLNVDLAVLGGSLNGEAALFEFTLRPLVASTIEVELRTEFIALGQRHAFSSTVEGRRPAVSPPQPEDEAMPEDDLENEQDGTPDQRNDDKGDTDTNRSPADDVEEGTP